MATVFRTHKTTTDPATGKRVKVTDSKGRPVPHPKYRIEYTDWTGKRKVQTGTTDKRETERIAARLEADADAIRKGWKEPPKQSDKAKARPFADVVAEYLQWGAASGGRRGHGWSEGHFRMRRTHLAWWGERLGINTLSDLDGILPKAEKALRELQAEGKSGKTLSNTAEALKAFCAWSVDRSYLKSNPLERLNGFDTTARTQRRALTTEELQRLLDATPAERAMLYAMAAGTGLRAGELRALKVSDINPDRPLIHVRAEVSKSRKAAMQPIPAILWERLRAESAGKAPDARLLKDLKGHESHYIDKDLKAADIQKWNPQGKIDFHSLRNLYVTMLYELGLDLKTIQTLARHSTPDLTANVYGRARQDRLENAAAALSSSVFSGPDNITYPKQKVAGAESEAITGAYGDHAAGSSPVAHPTISDSFQDNFKDKQGQETDKTLSTSGPEQSDAAGCHMGRSHARYLCAWGHCKGFSDSKEGRTSDVKEVREKYGLPE